MKFDIEHYVKINCIEDITKRELYRPEVDTDRSQLEGVIEPYILPDNGSKIRCSINSCHTPHFNGFLVRISDGYETNIGKDCGKKHFPEFVSHFNAASKRKRTRMSKERLNEVIANASEIQTRIQNLIDQECGGSWLHRGLKNFTAHYPNDVVQRLRKMAQRGENAVIQSRRRSDEEIDDLLDANPGNRRDQWLYESATVGTLRGLKIFTSPIRQTLVVDLKQTLDEVISADKATLTSRKLNEFVRWRNDMDQRFELVEQLIQAGQRFFQLENLALLKKLELSDASRQRMDSLQWSYNQADITPASKAKLGK